MKNKISILRGAASLALLSVFLALPVRAQLTIEFAGQKNALQFNYGGVGISFPALQISSGNAGTGAGSVITLVTGQSVTSSGVALSPITTTTPITIGIGANAETVTPTAVSNCNLPAVITPGPGTPSCTVTANLSNTHGPQEPVTSGTYGLQEALNRASGQGGGAVIIDAAWSTAGGTNAMVAAATFPANVTLVDNRLGGAGGSVNLTISISNAAFLASNATPVVVLPAPGAGNEWDIIDMVVENKNAGVAYANGGVSALYFGTSSSGVLASATVAASFFTSPTVAHSIKVAGALADTASSSIANAGVVFTNPTANFITGTGTVILKVSARLLTGL